MKLAVWMSLVVDRRSVARSVARREQLRRRWCDEFRLSSHGHGSAVMLGGESEGDCLQKTLHTARVSAQSTPCKWSGNLKEGRERESSSFHHFRNSFRAWARSHVLVECVKRQGTVPDAPDLARKSALSLPQMPQCAGHQTVETCQPRCWRLLMTLRVWHAYSWLDALNRRVSAAAWLSMHMNTGAREAVVIRRLVTASYTVWSSASYTSALLPRWQQPSPRKWSC